jgi:hypothetical protein
MLFSQVAIRLIRLRDDLRIRSLHERARLRL